MIHVLGWNIAVFIILTFACAVGMALAILGKDDRDTALCFGCAIGVLAGVCFAVWNVAWWVKAGGMG